MPSNSLVGREEDVASTVARLGRNRVVTVTGLGGIGKTRLALEIARRVPSGPWEKVCFTDLTPLTDGAFIAGSIASAMHPPLPGVETIGDLVVQLADRSVLLILDNCEHLIDEAAAAAYAIIVGCPQVTVLATSRERLRISGESVYRLSPLALPDRAPRTLEAASDYSALDLFLQRARQRDPSILFANDSVGFVYNICRRLEGIPLAIELAVARLPFFGLKMLDARLEEHFSLPGAPRDLPSRHRTMEATIAWSIQLLAEPERDLFARLSIFSGGFTLDAAQSVCASDIVDRPSVLNLLASLADKSLVEVVQKANDVRYVLLESVRAFASGLLERSKLRTATARSHAEWLAGIGDGVSSPISFEVFAELAPELDNARAALAWTLSSHCDDDHALGGRIITGLRELWVMSGRPSELRNASVASLARIDEAKYPKIAAKMLHNYIVSAFNEPGALEAIERAIPLFDRIGDTRATLALHSSLTFIFAYRGLIAEARASARRVEALSSTEQSKMSHEYLTFLYSRAMLREIEERFDDARADIAAAEVIAAALDFGTFIVRKLKLRLVYIEFGAGNARRAIEIAKEMLASEHGANPEVVSIANQCLALVHLLLGEPDEAEAAVRVVLDLTQSDESLVVQYVAGIAALRGYPHVAARLMGFIDALLDRVPSQRDSLQQQTWDVLCASVSRQLEPEVMALRRTEGRSLSNKAASAEALAALALPKRVGFAHSSVAPPR